MSWRRPTQDEVRYLARLLEQPFPGRDELRAQLENLQVEPHSGCRSLALRSAGGPAAPVTTRVPVEAQASDRDGAELHMLLHVLGGYVQELEIMREGDGGVIALPPPEDWELFLPYPGW